MTLTTPGGKPDSSTISASIKAVNGATSLGLTMTVQPAASAGQTLAIIWCRGKFHGVIQATTPTGYLKKLHTAMAARQDELGEVMAGEVGMPLGMAKPIQAGLPLQGVANFIKILDSYSFEETIGNSDIIKEPVGVVACITPWNFPLHQIMAKVCPALAAGCTVIVKPSEVAPLTAFMLAEMVEESGFPPGVVNVITGLGPALAP